MQNIWNSLLVCHRYVIDIIITVNSFNYNMHKVMFKRLLQTHSPYIITEKIKTLYKYYQ